MSTKALVFIFMSIGSVVGSYVPALWGGDTFSMSSLVLGSVFAIVGIWVGFRIGQSIN